MQTTDITPDEQTSNEKRIHALRSRGHADTLRELRELLTPILEELLLQSPPAPLTLRLLQIRLHHGTLCDVLSLHRHPQMHAYHHEVREILESYDADHLEWTDWVVECIEDATDEVRPPTDEVH